MDSESQYILVKMFVHLPCSCFVFYACCFVQIRGELSEELFETVGFKVGETASRLAMKSSIQCSAR